MNEIELERKLNKPFNKTFGGVLEESIELFKKVWLQGLLSALIGGLVMMPIVFLMYIPMIVIMVPLGLVAESGQFSEETSIGVAIVLSVLMFVFMICMMGVMLGVQFSFRAAFYRICKTKDFTNSSESDDYFFFLKKKNFKKLFVLGLYTMLIIVVGLFLFIIPAIILAVPLMYLPVVFSFNQELSARDLLKMSFKIGMKYWWLTMGISIVAYFLAMFVGLLACGIGIYVTMSFIYIPLYIMYKEAIGFSDENSIDEIGRE
ncbi:hypothetical protein [Pseudofulvibacter geojedonensis]